MFATSIYFSNTKEFTEENFTKLIESKDAQKKIAGMKELISFVSQGNPSTSLIHKVVKEVLLFENNELKRLFYYFLEICVPFIDKNEILLLNNQIRKDLESPNEFIRGLTLRFVSTLRSRDILNNCYKSIKHNLMHSVGYVRRNAYFCFGMIYMKLGIFEEVPKILYESLCKEMDAACLCQAYTLLWDIDQEKALNFAYSVYNSKGKEFSLLLIDKISDTNFLQQFVEDEESEVRLLACLKLIECTTDKKLLERYVDISFGDLKEHNEYCEDAFAIFTKKLDLLDLSKYMIEIFSYVNPFNYDLSKVCLRFAFNICKIKTMQQFLEISVDKYEEIEKVNSKTKKTEIMILEQIFDFIYKFGVYNDKIMSICERNLTLDFPELAYLSLRLISVILEKSHDSKIVDLLIDSIPRTKYGKHYRLIFKLLVKYSNLNQFKKTYELFDSNLRELCNSNKESEFLIYTETMKFLLGYVCISFTEIFYRTCNDEDYKCKLIALFLCLTKVDGLCDTNTKSTIFLCIKSLTAGLAYKHSTEIKEKEVQNIDVLEPLRIPFFKADKKENISKLVNYLKSENRVESLKNVIQLTGLSDPIYVEAEVVYGKYEIELNMLLINQTDNYLQNMLFDFGTSHNIRPVRLELPGNMKSRSAVYKKLVFRLLDSSCGFINGVVTFKYPNENGEYANQNYTLNFSEIKTNVSDFLEKKYCEPEKFKTLWKNMSWENVYSVRVFTDENIKNVFELFIRFVNGTVINQMITEDIIVANALCTTSQNDDIFFNICLNKDDNFVNLECRIRSHKEEIVKSMSNILGKIVKEIRV